ncbi:MAG: 2-amino-4-hydroxy-6-hydroxymethyldihydropteridine diphosphokinase [Candidatus Nanopelagicaceae bacterium]
MTPGKKVVIAFGSNLGDRKEYIRRAIDLVGDDVVIEKISTIIETDPVGGPEQGRYLNGVLIGRSELHAAELMSRLLEIELALGRVRTIENGPRTIDLDLIDYDGIEMDTPLLTLPHPRAHQRYFVITPWAEVDPDAQLPGIGTLSEIIRMNGWSS